MIAEWYTFPTSYFNIGDSAEYKNSAIVMVKALIQ